MMFRPVLLLLVAAATGLLPTAGLADIGQDRRIFLETEKLLTQGRFSEAEASIEALRTYPLYSYLRYRLLLQSLDNDTAIREFLDRYGQSRQAGPLRAKWLERLAARGAWGDYLKEYRPTDEPGPQCRLHLAQFHAGQREAAYAGAEKLWMTGDALPDACEVLFAQWRQSSAYSLDLLWRRYFLAMRKNNKTLLAQLQGLVPADRQSVVGDWQRIQQQPRQILSCSGWERSSPASGLLFVYGIERLANDNPALAEAAWNLHKGKLVADKALVVQTDRRLGLALATSRYEQAGSYLAAMDDDVGDGQTRSWRLRVAMLQHDWAGVLSAFEGLSADEQRQAEWRYWRARALEALGGGQPAREVFAALAGERDYYGFLAADRLERNYPLEDRPLEIPASELNRLANSPPVAAVVEWRALDRQGDAKTEWLHAIKSLSPQDQIVAAKLAQSWGWDQMAMAAAVKSGSRGELALRFPTLYSQMVLGHAQSQQIEPALVFGLIRRESAFDPQIGSAAGAQGLMQLMPGTGEQMARRLNDKLPERYGLLDPDRNVRYGTAYLRGLLDRFGNHVALATAAYNAGPNNVERWLPAGSSLPADVWVETIPYVETRQYVKAVLSNAVVYRHRLGNESVRLSRWLPEIPAVAKTPEKADRVEPIPLCD